MSLTLWSSLALGRPNPGPPPKRVDIKPIREELRFFHDGKGHYLALMPDAALEKIAGNVFYGDGKKFYLVPAASSSRGPGYLNFSVNDPRMISRSESYFKLKNGKASFTCNRRKTALTRLPPGDVLKLLKRARFHGTYWQRRAHALARDDDGRYFYVDRLTKNRYGRQPKRGMRVFVGPRGKMKLVRMKNLINDPAGEIFITSKGKLRLILSSSAPGKASAAEWTSSAKRIPLVRVRLNDPRTVPMIYNELGVYTGAILRRPCDDL